jgi:uncharacterized protein
MIPNRNTAILFFSRSLKEEFLAKPFGLSAQRFSTFYNCLLKKTRTTLESIDVDIIESFSTSQKGKHFGGRLTNAVLDVFNKGYENVIIVGNDAPSLSPDHLFQAKTLIEQGNNVIAPDTHGGAFLIGISKRSFDEKRFKSIHWGTKTVFDELKFVFEPEELQVKVTDLNDLNDVKRLLELDNSLPHNFRKLLKNIFFSSHPSANVLIRVFQDFSLQTLALRGPPISHFL